MAFDFPSSPAVDDVFTDTISGVSYKWNGYAWSRTVMIATATVDYVDVAGDAMTGPLLLSEHPTAASPVLQAATRGYADGLALPTGGTQGQVLAINATNIPTWGAPADGGNF